MPTICLIPGDGVGQEVIPAAARVLVAVLPDARFVEADAGWDCYLRRGTALPDETLRAVAEADATLFGATQSPMGGDLPSSLPGKMDTNSPLLAGEGPGVRSTLAGEGPGVRSTLAEEGPGVRSTLAGEGPGVRSTLAEEGPGVRSTLAGEGPGVRPTLSGDGQGYRSPILALRKHFDLYANLRPTVQLVPGGRPIDLLIVRENTEGLYSGREHWEGPDAAIAERVITRRASERIARVAFEQARRRIADRELQIADSSSGPGNSQPAIRNPKLTIVHKANVLKLTDGLFRASCLAVARDYPDVQVEEMLVDAAAMWLAKDPTRFDVIVTTNLFGDILSDLAAGLAGGLGVAPSANVGAGRVAMFEPVHGSAPDIAGQGIANPIGAILSAAMLLDHLGEAAAATRVRRAVQTTVAAGIVTPDLGGRATTEQVTDEIIKRLMESSLQAV